MNAVGCQHIREVGGKTMYKDKVELRKSDLDDLSHEGEFKMIKRERIYQCISLSHEASKNIADQRRLDKQAAKHHGYECLIARATSLIL